jgi:hypothetical protein
MSGHPVAPQIRLTTSATATTSHMARRGPPVDSWMWARARGPNPSRPNAYSIRPDAAVVAMWQAKAETIAVRMITKLNHCPTYVLPKSPNVFPDSWKAVSPASSVPKPMT